MFFSIKKLLFAFTFNFSLFLILMIGIQNSSTKRKVNMMVSQTVNLPIGFIVGFSFISGSIAGSILQVDFGAKKG